jgi:glycine cleavage system transcriptional repressor
MRKLARSASGLDAVSSERFRALSPEARAPSRNEIPWKGAFDEEGSLKRKQLVLTASGRDRVGVVDEMAELILRFGGNVESSRMVRLGGDFAMLMFVTAPEDGIEDLRSALAEVHYARYDIHTRLSEVSEPEETAAVVCAITVLGADHMGIIHQVTRYLAEQGINIETLTTEVSAAPMSGTPLFAMSAMVRVPPQLEVEDLREALEFIGDEVGVDTKVFPHVDQG